MSAPRASWLLLSLHFALTLTAPLVFLSMLGCLKAKATKEDLGPVVPADVVNQALAKVVAKADFNGIAIGSYLDFSDTRRIENQDTAITLGARHIEVIDRKDTTDQATFTLKITNSTRQNNDKFLTTVTQDELALDKSPDMSSVTAVPSSLRARGVNSYGKISTQSLVQAMDVTPQKITFHHLRESDATIDPPLPVKQRANCDGLVPCSLPMHYIQFDMVLWNTDTDYQKISFDFGFTYKAPFLPFGSDFDQLSGALIIDCRSTYIPVESRTVYVRDCLSLEDFHK